MWNDLTMQQRADVIAMAVKAGMRDMSSIRSFYDKTVGSGRRFDEGGDTNTTADTTATAQNTPQGRSTEEINPVVQFVKNYVNSDAYKRRFKASGDLAPDTYAGDNINRVAIENVQDTENPIDASEYSSELRNTGIVNKVIMDTNSKYGSYNTTLAHELGHVVDPHAHNYYAGREPNSYLDLYNRRIRGAVYTMVDKNGNEIIENVENSHDKRPMEIYADLMALRYDLFNRGIYDSTKNEPFTQKHLDAYINALVKEQKFKQTRLMNMFKSSDIIDMMNTIAYNPSENPTDNTMAALGGKLNKFPKGGALAKKVNPQNPQTDTYNITQRHIRGLSYIGGTTEEARDTFWKKFPKIKAATDSIANAYGISPLLLRNRLNHEGFVDRAIANNNSEYFMPTDRDISDNAILNGYSSGFGSFGLDDVGTLINEGKIKLINERWEEEGNLNEKGRKINSAQGDTTLDNIGITAAALKYFRDKAQKVNPNMSSSQLDRAAAIYFNRGISGGQQYINDGGSGYNIQEKYGGFIPIKKAKSKNKFTTGGYLASTNNAHIYDGNTEESQQMVDGITGATLSMRDIALERSRKATSPNTDFTNAMDLPLYSSIPATYAPRLFFIDPHTCINTVTGFYDPKHTIANNANLWANPEDYGYEQIPQASARPGDIIVLSNKDNYPNHAVMFDSVAQQDSEKYGYPIHKGDTLVNYSNGGRGKNDYRVQATLKRFDDPESAGGDFSGERRYFKYTGRRPKKL